MAKSKTATSTPRLSEYARHFVYPDGIERTVWPRVEAKGRELGLGFDWWQSQLGTVCLGYGPDGKYVATVGGIGLSIPRQVGKTYFVLAMLVILCILFPGLQVVWTAHHLRTSTKTFTTLRGMCRRKKIAPHIKPGGIRAANGEQQVAFTNGSMIMFGARSMGFGRGFDEIDVEVFDEAQILDTKALEDMIAATNQARHEHGALLFFMGTPPRPTDPSDAFTDRRRKAITGKATNAVWLEIGAERGSDPDDRAQWPLMNPSYPTRTPEESMLRLRENLSDEDSWNREGRGVWDEDSSEGVFGSAWADCRVETSSIADQLHLGLAVSLDRTTFAIGAAGVNADGLVHLEMTHEPGADRTYRPKAVVAECKRLQDTHHAPLVVDGKGPASSLLPALLEAGVEVVEADTAGICDAFVDLYDRVQAGDVVHLGDPEIDAAVRAADTRTIGDRMTLRRRGAKHDVSPVEAVMLAQWRVEKRMPESVPSFAYR